LIDSRTIDCKVLGIARSKMGELSVTEDFKLHSPTPLKFTTLLLTVQIVAADNDVIEVCPSPI
jgi:hypothetical protein